MYTPILFLFHWTENFFQGCALTIVLRPKWGVKSVLIYATLGMAVPVLYVLLGGQIWRADWLRSAAGISVWFVIFYFVFEGRVLKKLLTYLFLFMLIFLAESSTMLFFVIMGRQETVLQAASAGDMSAYLQMQPVFLLFQIFYVILAALLWKKHRRQIDLRGTRMFLFFLITQAILLFLLYFISLKSMPDYFAWVVLAAETLCTAADIGVYQAAVSLSQKTVLEQENEIYEKQLAMQLAHYEAFLDYDAKLRDLRHDLHNQLQAVRALMERKEGAAASTLMEELERQVRDLQTISFCENPIISALVFVKQKEMEKQEIRFTAELRAEDDLAVEKTDLCRIFGNLLDNAIEACEKIPDPAKRWILLKCGSAGGYFIVSCVNSFCGRVTTERDGLPRSDKKEGGHGRGLRSLNGIARRYEGELRWEIGADGCSFQTAISLRLRRV
ncbi:sensor histidine kinase [Bacilliculturomica massiliensis]|uniref:sensor histidine kinase n=1 Tax=Bacilliculturomica massiliensis TaxID=1917867 RepID=UPI0010322EB6|nr:sensor histidine kinase [Bacilliculturomica massiliensis]